MKRVTTTNYGKQCAELGYDLFIHTVDLWGNSRKYGVYPANSSGAISHFDNLAQLREWLHDVQMVRDMQTMTDNEWNETIYRRREIGLRDNGMTK